GMDPYADPLMRHSGGPTGDAAGSRTTRTTRTSAPATGWQRHPPGTAGTARATRVPPARVLLSVAEGHQFVGGSQLFPDEQENKIGAFVPRLGARVCRDSRTAGHPGPAGGCRAARRSGTGGATRCHPPRPLVAAAGVEQRGPLAGFAE